MELYEDPNEGGKSPTLDRERREGEGRCGMRRKERRRQKKREREENQYSTRRREQVLRVACGVDWS